MSNWQPIETAPKDGRSIRTRFHPRGVSVSVQWRDHDDMEDGPGWIDDYGRYFFPKQWEQN